MMVQQTYTCDFRRTHIELHSGHCHLRLRLICVIVFDKDDGNAIQFTRRLTQLYSGMRTGAQRQGELLLGTARNWHTGRLWRFVGPVEWDV